jgi:hypothetical protein
MDFRIELSRVRGFSYRLPADADSPFGILSDVCEALDDAGGAEFVVSGMGEARWNLDVGTDLLTFLEQLPAAIVAVKARKSFEIDLYEQGVARRLLFDPADDQYVIRGASSAIASACWSPEPERLALSTLSAMLIDALDAFMEFLRTYAPQVAASPLIRMWADGRITPWGDAATEM